MPGPDRTDGGTATPPGPGNPGSSPGRSPDTSASLSLRARLVTALSRRLARPALARQHDPQAARADFLRAATRFALDPAGALYREVPGGLGGRPALRASVPPRDGAGLILYLHGGAFVMGSPRTHRALAARLAAQAGMAAVLSDYRLAPEHPFPAALDDALSAYTALLERGHPAERLCLAGDSAGGGLALSLMAEAARRGLPRPAGLVAFSPFADLTRSGASWTENAQRDPLLPAERGADVPELWLQGNPPEDPRASPLLADWPAPPAPTLLFAARTELLRDDALRMAARLRAAGGRAEARIAGDLPHVWPWLAPWLPEANRTLAEAGAFLAACLPPQ
ncbi:MAG: alpha/beta hydrolase [Alkalilacustris sp.]